MTSEIRSLFTNGMKVKAKIEGRAADKKFCLFKNQGVQTDDIGGYYIETSAIPDVWKDATIIEHLDGKGKLRKYVQWINGKGEPTERILRKFKNGDVIKD